ncbi:RNA polymerase sigma-70 factor, ECF subfamily [Polaribacter sp. KT25b]|uniref:RNA polymerase sigma factor n=1 Tax=Polaribacter sp. KT25b TaxID=1855336 RepID=UPI00087C5CD9|nr:sigma-70 family RNA polymerase sigma factor [Polaribacter sp. KT25b]SDR98214.1 RNA polymerase sigma-70 factor, ECF subfamily [Polaribacter sp. KT25b]
MNQSDFLKVVLPFKDKVFRLAKRLLVSTEEAEDATQELIFKLWRSKEKIADYNNVEAFAMTMTKNYCFDRLKSKQASNLTLVHSNYKEKDTSLDKQMEYQDSVNQVHLLIEKLPEQQKIIIQLRDIEEYDFDEICKMVDMKPTAVRVALSRARKTIREELIKKHNYGVS